MEKQDWKEKGRQQNKIEVLEKRNEAANFWQDVLRDLLAPNFLQIAYFYPDCVSFEDGLKGKMNGDYGLYPFNLLLRMFIKYVKMNEGHGDRGSRRNSRPSLDLLVG